MAPACEAPRTRLFSLPHQGLTPSGHSLLSVTRKCPEVCKWTETCPLRLSRHACGWSPPCSSRQWLWELRLVEGSSSPGRFQPTYQVPRWCHLRAFAREAVNPFVVETSLSRGFWYLQPEAARLMLQRKRHFPLLQETVRQEAPPRQGGTPSLTVARGGRWGIGSTVHTRTTEAQDRQLHGERANLQFRREEEGQHEATL